MQPDARDLGVDGTRTGVACRERRGNPSLDCRIVASVLGADFARLGEEVAALEQAGIDRVQWDVMDGRFVPNLTLGPDIVRRARAHTRVPFEAHLMVVEPEWMLPLWVERLRTRAREAAPWRKRARP